jgi:hypothetical protein
VIFERDKTAAAIGCELRAADLLRRSTACVRRSANRRIRSTAVVLCSTANFFRAERGVLPHAISSTSGALVAARSQGAALAARDRRSTHAPRKLRRMARVCDFLDGANVITPASAALDRALFAGPSACAA